MTKELRIEKQRYMYLHKDIQNEVIEVMAFRLLRDKNKSINKSAFIFVKADEVTDCCNDEQFYICFC